MSARAHAQLHHGNKPEQQCLTYCPINDDGAWLAEAAVSVPGQHVRGSMYDLQFDRRLHGGPLHRLFRNHRIKRNKIISNKLRSNETHNSKFHYYTVLRTWSIGEAKWIILVETVWSSAKRDEGINCMYINRFVWMVTLPESRWCSFRTRMLVGCFMLLWKQYFEAMQNHHHQQQ